MNDYLEEAKRAITALQGKERSAVWMVGEQLKDMIRDRPDWAELVAKDLKVKEMDLAACEKKIKAYADKHKTGNFACVTPAESEEIICKFYGLNREEKQEKQQKAPSAGNMVDLSRFF